MCRVVRPSGAAASSAVVLSHMGRRVAQSAMKSAVSYALSAPTVPRFAVEHRQCGLAFARAVGMGDDGAHHQTVAVLISACPW